MIIFLISKYYLDNLEWTGEHDDSSVDQDLIHILSLKDKEPLSSRIPSL